MTTTTECPAWEQELTDWEDKYQPIKNHFSQKQEGEFVEDKFETYGEELDYVRSVYDKDPRRVWTLVDGDDGNLYIVDGYHLVNRINYFVTEVPFEGKFMEVPYYIYDEEEQEDEL
tara:strand:- start:930 stop:1277 length:348 start_codon:yes stop_codon:yes gene_type:complete